MRGRTWAMPTRPSCATPLHAASARSALTPGSSPGPTSTARRSSAPPELPVALRRSSPTKIAGEFRGLWDRLGLTYNDFIRTTEQRHKRGVQHLFSTLRDNGYIYKGSYTGQYCVSDEAYVDGPPGTLCPDCGRLTETVSEENYFFKLSAFERKLLEFYDANPDFMGPESTRREIISFVRSGLKDLSVSRTSFSWGIPDARRRKACGVCLARCARELHYCSWLRLG